MSRPQSASKAAGYDGYDLGGGQNARSPSPVRASKPPARSGGGGGGGGDNSNIDIFLRVRPVKSPSNRLIVDQTENRVEFNIPRDARDGYVNNQRENYEFRFNGIIGPEAKQDEVCCKSLHASMAVRFDPVDQLVCGMAGLRESG